MTAAGTENLGKPLRMYGSMEIRQLSPIWIINRRYGVWGIRVGFMVAKTEFLRLYIHTNALRSKPGYQGQHAWDKSHLHATSLPHAYHMPYLRNFRSRARQVRIRTSPSICCARAAMAEGSWPGMACAAFRPRACFFKAFTEGGGLS